MRRSYKSFRHKEAAFRVCCDRFEAVTREIIRQRGILENYVRSHPRFGSSLVPVDAPAGAPEVARRMAGAGRSAGVGPMAAVAGAMAQLAAEAGLEAGAQEAVIENGGDVYMVLAASSAVVGLHAGTNSLGDRLAFSVEPSETPLAVCSSSGRMGHSYSMGSCDLATVVAADAALADAAATRAANGVRAVDDIDRTANEIMAIEGVRGVLIVKEDRVGMAGKLPELIRNAA
jgi:ApbE superfamily uncharacterized protein (UPF0280 family)